MSGFKLLAIRPLKGCDAQFRKNLKEGVVYKFYQDYDYYVNSNGKETLITDKNYEEFASEPISNVERKGAANDLDLYSDGDLKINISAVVGENGSGKSSLMELFYLALFLYDYKELLRHKLLKAGVDFEFEDSDTFDEIIKNYDDKFQNKNNDVNSFKNQLVEFKTKIFYCELFFCNGDNEKYSLSINTSKTNEQSWSDLKIFNKEGEVPKFIDFYTIGMNYSLHSLDPKELGNWIEQIFHKNDAYQTPLVLNPKREEKNGEIDIQNEKSLQKSRMLLNIVELSKNPETNKKLLNSKNIAKINFSLNLLSKKFELPYLEIVPANTLQIYKTKNEIINGKTGEELIQLKRNITLFEVIEKRIDMTYDGLNKIEKICFHYIAYKICKTWKWYPNIFLPATPEIEVYNKILDYSGHITLKIRQAINFIIYQNDFKKKLESEYDSYFSKIDDPEAGGDILAIGNLSPIHEPIKFSLEVNGANKLKGKIISNNTSSRTIDPIDLLPPAFIDYDFQFSENENDTFNNLSSGEKQQIYSVHTILYHIRNVLSVPDGTELRKFNSINVFLDEIELYFHPEMQRQFVNNLVQAIKVLKKEKLFHVNILFSTHSPFILSDIPSNNILRLINGEPSTEKFGETFGANIHDLLANDFFLRDGFMGEFAKEKINEVIVYLNHEKLEREFDDIRGKDYKETQALRKKIKTQIKSLPKKTQSFTKLSDCLEIIKLIGEPALKNTLLHQYNTILDFDKSSQHKWLEKLADELGYNLSKKK